MKESEIQSISKKWKENLPDKYRIWIDICNKYELSESQVSMAVYLGMNPDELDEFINLHTVDEISNMPEIIEDLFFTVLYD